MLSTYTEYPCAMEPDNFKFVHLINLSMCNYFLQTLLLLITGIFSSHSVPAASTLTKFTFYSSYVHVQIQTSTSLGNAVCPKAESSVWDGIGN